MQGEKGGNRDNKKISGFADALERNRRNAGLPMPNADESSRNSKTNTGSSMQASASIYEKALKSIRQLTSTTRFIAVLAILGVFIWLFGRVLNEGGEDQTNRFLDEDVSDIAPGIAKSIRENIHQPEKPSSKEPALRGRLANEVCTPDEKLRTMGTQWLDASEYADGVVMSIRNRSDQIAFLDFKKMGEVERATTIVVMPGDAIKFPLAGAGTIGTISTGSQWCNRRAGWQDAKSQPIRPAIVPLSDTTEIKSVLFEKGGGLVGMRIFKVSKTNLAPPQFD